MTPPRIGIVITTRNRRNLLRHVLHQTMAQNYPDLSIVVFDDASTDGTAEMLRSEFPSVRVERNDAPRGYIVNRNRAAEIMSDCRYLISLDDDSWMLRSDGAERVVELFSSHPDAALFAFEIFGSYHLPLPPDLPRNGAPIASFAGCGYAIDRERFLKLGGFPACFEFYGEENDFVMKVMDAGWTCRFAPTVPIYHAETLIGRDENRIREYSLANSLTLFCLREPLSVCIPHVAYVMVHRAIKWGLAGHLRSVVSGLRRWLGRINEIRRMRKPVRLATLRQFRALQHEWRDYILARRTSPEARQSVPLPSCLEQPK